MFQRWRFILVIIILASIIAGIVVRLFWLDTVESSFLINRGNAEAIHTITIPVERGVIYDRNGVPLAVSAPLDNIIFDPKIILQHPKTWQQIIQNPALHISARQLHHLLKTHPNLQFWYAKKNVPPSVAADIQALGIPGVSIQKHSQTFYPLGAPDAQLVGFTNAQNKGQDGLELTYNSLLAGHPGKAKVVMNALGQILSVVKIIKKPQPGQNIYLSIDSRIQYIAYKALRHEVRLTKAVSGSAVVVNPQTGELLAAVSYPSFNPNHLADRVGPQVRDRAITDTYEPASTMKAFVVATAIDLGKVTPTTKINTSPGYYMLEGHRIQDDGDFGDITVTQVLQKSSNVGASKILLSLPHNAYYTMLMNAGFGSAPGGGVFPAETAGYLPALSSLGKFSYTTLAFGYGLSVSSLQLARAYTAIANGGLIYPISFLKRKHPPMGERIMKAKSAAELRMMLHAVVLPGGTGFMARIPGYNVAGKTGTSNRVKAGGGFSYKYYNAVFAGFAPLKHPRLVIVVHINSPIALAADRFGGLSAAPVFAKIAEQSLPILGVDATTPAINVNFFRQRDLNWRSVIDN